VVQLLEVKRPKARPHDAVQVKTEVHPATARHMRGAARRQPCWLQRQLRVQRVGFHAAERRGNEDAATAASGVGDVELTAEGCPCGQEQLQDDVALHDAHCDSNATPRMKCI
jgi:hypothetical protein